MTPMHEESNGVNLIDCSLAAQSKVITMSNDVCRAHDQSRYIRAPELAISCAAP